MDKMLHVTYSWAASWFDRAPSALTCDTTGTGAAYRGCLIVAKRVAMYKGWVPRANPGNTLWCAGSRDNSLTSV